MRHWSFKYMNWRLTTAYPEGFLYAFKHPFKFFRDGCNFLEWCREIDNELKKRLNA